MGTPIIETNKVTVKFGEGPRQIVAVNSVSIRVAHSETVGIVGESGSGKSTLARVLVGLQPIDEGVLRFQGSPVAQTASPYPGAERRKVQLVSQDPYTCLNPRLTAVSSVAEAIRFWDSLSRSESLERAFALLASLGIGRQDARKKPRMLSGGQRQRVNVARALAPDPLVLVADEPTSAIDQSAQAQLLNLLRELQQERDLTLLFISHDLGVIRYITSRVYVMRDGFVVEEGATQELFENPQHDYTRLLLRSIPGSLRKTRDDGTSMPTVHSRK